MRVLRANKESVTAMLEAFVHDPLINWRLLNTVEAGTGGALPAATSVTAGESQPPPVTTSGESKIWRCMHTSFDR